ncbi:hypothetical protein [Halanaerobium sp. ST460_2HS_T2]|nr:hypothetical protein [Halanaerobium sp. ST460_2HS_T2]RCW56203.1 hypothetical protein DFR80_1155 [Halanaerobium sp. ST460_2HS_T2]
MKYKQNRKIFAYLAMIVLSIFFIFPLFYMISVSLNPDETAILRNMASVRAFFPGDLSLKNFFDVFDRMPFARFLFN